MSTPGGGSNEFLSARIDFEIPQEAMSQMREFNSELERVRINSESAARGVDSFMRYIELMNAAQERTIQTSRNLAANLERIMQIQERAGQAESGTAVPQQYTTPWGGTSEGMGGAHRDVRPIPTTIPAVGGSQAEFDHLMQNDPRAYLNARAAWGGRQPGEQLPPVSISDASLDRLARTIDARDRQHEEQQTKTAPDHPSAPPSPTGRGGGRPAPSQRPDTAPWEAWRNRAAQWTGAAGTVMSGMGVGGSFSGMLGIAGRALQGWGARQGTRSDPAIGGGPGSTVPRVRRGSSGGTPPSVPTEGETEEGGGGGGGEEPAEDEGAGSLSLGKAAGIGGAGLGIGLGVFGAIQKGGQEYQRYKNLGSIRGGGFSEGFGYEMQARIMALNPFITTEQSRQIIQSALTNGYTGKEYDTVTQFMAANLKDMNMSVAESTDLLQKGVKGSNESIGEMTKNMSANLAAMKDLSKSGYNSLPDRQKEMQQTFDAMRGAGVGPDAAGGLGTMFGQDFANMPGMQGVGGQLGSSIAGSMQFQQLMRTQGGIGGKPLNIPGLDPADPGAVLEALQDQGGDSAIHDAAWRTLKQVATWAPNPWVFQGMLRRMLGMNVDRPTAEQLWKAAKAVDTGTDDDPIKQGQKAKEEMDKSRKSKNQSYDTGRANLFNLQHPLGLGAPLGANPLGGRPVAPVIGQVEDSFGSTAQVQDRSGQWHDFDPNDQGQLQGIAAGRAHVRRRGEMGGGQTIDQFPSGGGKDGGGKGGVQGHLQITVHPASMRSVLNIPSFIPLTANEQAANAGWGNSRKNDPPPGDSITSRGARGG
jgi:hypothetical protein